VDTSSPSHLRILAQLHIDTLYRYNALGCPSDSNAQMKIKVSGGNPPYTYAWGGGSYHQLDTLGVGFPKGTYLITVTDSDTTHCVSREFTIETLRLHTITFHMNPPDTVYLSNPMVTVTIPDTAAKHLDNWNWDFDDKTNKVASVNPCQHDYAKIGTFYVKLNFTDNVGGQLCDSTIIDTMTVKTIRLFIPNVITPGSGDDNGRLNIRQLNPTDSKPFGANLDLSEIYLSNQMFIFNRQGQKVFEKTNYNSGDWDGGNLAAGVYFYILKCHGEFGDEVYRGAVTIIRN
jgi:PKD repeat protein